MPPSPVRLRPVVLPLLLLQPQAVPANDACSGNGTVLTCSGNQADGIAFQMGFGQPLPPLYDQLVVEALTASIVPTGFTVPGILFSDTASPGGDNTGGGTANDLTISFAGGSFGVQSVATGIAGTAVGGAGGNGTESKPFEGGGKVGNPGGAGGAGGGLSLDLQSGFVTTQGPEASALYLSSAGAAGGSGGTMEPVFANAHGGLGGNGGAGGAVSVQIAQGAISQESGGYGTLFANSTGAAGGTGGQGTAYAGAGYGGVGGAGGGGGPIDIGLGAVTFTLDAGVGPAVLVQSVGAAGGTGGEGWSDVADGNGGAGGVGGNGGTIGIASNTQTLPGTLVIDTSQAGQHGVQANSVAGPGGAGGTGHANTIKGTGGDGGVGGTGGAVTIDLDGASIKTLGDQALGIFARSYGGAGGAGGPGTGADGHGGAGAGSGPGGTVDVTFIGTLTTAGSEASGVFAQSVGGFAGTGGTASGFVAYGASDQSAGGGGDVTVATPAADSTLTTIGDWASALVAQSVGGGGGNGSKAVGVGALGGTGSAGGKGGQVTVTNAATLATGVAGGSGQGSRGISAQSVGGGGGEGGGAGGLVAIGGAAGPGGSGGQVQVTNSGTLTTQGGQAGGIHASSHGGGGGSGHSTVGIASLGGKGGGGGDGGGATVANSGNITTNGDDADGVAVQSLGGGGGKGSSAVAISAGFSLAIGGSGGSGGAGQAATYTDNGADDYRIVTNGTRSRGIFVQSLGQGGGDAGNAVSVSASPALDINIGYGGSGGSGGDGGSANASSNAWITTAGDAASALFVQSIGGGGGNAGTTVAATAAALMSYGVTIGGRGGSAGSGGQAGAAVNGIVQTGGDLAHGVYVHSVGGGGGHAGATVTGALVSGLNLGATLGGSGGAGGSGGPVTVSADVALTTAGDHAYGVTAQSIGGGGGAAHFAGNVSGATGASLGLTLGGNGGAAGSGGVVAVDTWGSIGTGGSGAPGIAAMSLGGGGGDSGTTLGADALTFADFQVNLGGSGGAAGSGAAVTVANTADVATTGHLSEAIRAHSVGGGGGNAGVVAGAGGVSLGGLTVNVGGGGGAGGGSGKVKVTTQASLVSKGSLTTQGHGATAIDAKSIAGSGGNAKAAITASALSMGSLTATVGGNGGAGGTAGEVQVTADAALATSGDLAHGIVAQSLGGAGGEGAYAVEAGLTGGEVSGSLNVKIGGEGGRGGTGGPVTVQTQGSIATQGYGAHGLVAHSVGGNGGIGGAIYSGNLAFGSTATAQVNLNLGGDGGNGAVGGAVTVANGAGIGTSGHQAVGVVAQSIGGNGGLGGSVYTVVATVTPNSSVNIGGSVGGNGGTGNDAGTVLVDNTGAIATAGGAAHGIHAQSVGGGGGRAGSAANINVNLTGGSTGSSLNAAFNPVLGGVGGAAGHGNTVTVDNSATISTAGISAKGIVAQSVGGGGGDGGVASSDSIGLNGVCKLLTEGSFLCSSADAPEDTTQVSASLTVTVGGKGGAAGNGGGVSIDNTADIVTKGRLGHAIVAHSVGGGGGDGGEGALGIAAWTTSTLLQDLDSVSEWSTQIGDFTSVGVGVGGSEGASGSGGDVGVTNSATLWTQGDHAYGIHAYSVGGGGGSGGAGSTGFTTNITVGGAGSGGGDGGNVTVTSPGTIQTQGKGSVGIFAQSVGGGGGSAGDVEMGFTAEKLNIGVGVGVQQSAGNGGNGGVVSVTAGAIATTGAAAHGVVAHSVGGSGGMAGNPGLLGGGPLSFAGSVGDPGDAGAVAVTLNGPVTVSGQSAHGVFAQSASGKAPGNSSGKVTVAVNADLSASGAKGRAILAQSASVDNAQNGTIAIAVAPGVTVATGAAGWETIYIAGGANNTIDNQGTLTQGNPNSFVIFTDGVAATTVTNSGTIDGAVSGASVSGAAGELAGGTRIDIVNRPGGLVNAGRLLDVRRFDNQGTLAVGGIGHIDRTRLSGDLTQGPGGVLAVDLSPARAGTGQQGDLLDIGGQAVLGGRVVVNLLDLWQATPEPQSVPILAAAGGVGLASDLTPRSAVAQYRLSQPSPTELHLSYAIDFANPDILNATNANQDALARSIDALYRAQALDPATLRDLIAIPDGRSYAQAMDSLSAEPAADNLVLGLLSSLQFSDALLSCAQRGGDYRWLDDGQCGWLRLGGQRFEQRATRDNLGYGADAWQLAGGGQLRLGGDWYLGGGLTYERQDLDTDGGAADSQGEVFQGGLTLKRRWDATELAGSLTLGHADYALERTPWPGTAASADQGVGLAGLQVRLAHLFERGPWAFKPRLDLGLQYQSMDGYRESGTSPLRLAVEDQEETYVILQPAIDIATELQGAGGLLIRPRLTLGLTAFLGDATPSVTARFAADPAGLAPFSASTELDSIRWDLAAGVDVFTRGALAVRADAFANVSDSTTAYGGQLKLALAF